MKKKDKNIQILASTVIGAYHKAKNLPCQDCYKYLQKKDKVVAVISDGAGSAKYGKIGAKIICETLCDILISSSMVNIKQKIIDAITIARDKLILHRLNKTKSETSIINFAATVVGIYYYKNKGICFHIGDGACAIFLQNDKHLISQPENGFFSCETYFYTMDDWKDSLRFMSFEKAKNIMLMTDGVTSFAFKNNFDDIEAGFLKPINNYLQNEPSRKKAIRALNNTLSNPIANKLNPDDKTFLWIRTK